MANDIFGYDRPAPQAVFSSDMARMTVSSGSGGDMNIENCLVQNWNVTYRHDVQEIYEIGSSQLYWVKGHPVGEGSLGRIVGSAPNATKALRFFSDNAYNMCNGGDTYDITLIPGLCRSGSNLITDSQQVTDTVTLKLTGCVVTSIGFTINAQDVKISEELRFRFGSLELTS